MIQRQWELVHPHVAPPAPAFRQQLSLNSLPPMDTIAGQMGVGAYISNPGTESAGNSVNINKRGNVAIISPERRAGSGKSYGELLRRMPQV